MRTTQTPYFRAGYPYLFEPRINQLSNKEEYSVTALFKKGEDLTALKNLVHQTCVEKWGPDQKKWPKNLRSPFRDQAERVKDDGSLPDGYEEGAIFINLKSTKRPGVVDQSLKPISDPEKIYSGCWLRAQVSCYAYSQAGNNGVSFGLLNIQKVKDDDPITGRVSAEKAFTALEEDIKDMDTTEIDTTDSLFN